MPICLSSAYHGPGAQDQAGLGRGHSVVLTARSADAAATAAHEAAAEPLRLDVTDPVSVADAARLVGERYRKPDVLGGDIA